jgi:hypothetical protein
MENTRSDLEHSIAKLSRANIIMRWCILCLFALWSLSFAALLSSRKTVHAQDNANQVLRVRQLIVQDQNGVDRVWIGAPLPNPPVFGKRYKRSIDVSGILILDSEGNERGGYITNNAPVGKGSAFLSVDSVGDEQADFGAADTGGAELSLANGDASVTAGAADKPVLQLRQGKNILFDATKSVEPTK